MTTRLASFNADGFYEAIDTTRRARELNWKEVAKGAGVSPSTLTRLAQGKRPDVDSLAALLAWSGLEADQFVLSEKRNEPAPLAMIYTQLRSDRNLTPESASALNEIILAAYEHMRKEDE